MRLAGAIISIERCGIKQISMNMFSTTFTKHELRWFENPNLLQHFFNVLHVFGTYVESRGDFFLLKIFKLANKIGVKDLIIKFVYNSQICA